MQSSPVRRALSFLGVYRFCIFAENNSKMTIIQQPESFSFSSALKDIILESAVNVTVSFSAGSTEFLREIYTPDNQNRIYIRDLSRLPLPYISPVVLRQSFNIIVTPADGSAGSVINFTVQYSLTKINVSAEKFLENFFLTTLRNEKITYPEQNEFLSLVVSAATTIEIIAYRKSGSQSSRTIQISSSNVNKVVTVDVSPAIFSDPGSISYIVVTAGVRTFTFYLRRSSERLTQFIFINTFGVKETFIPSGVTLRENNYKNLFGYFSGLYRKYNIELVKLYTANTGVMTEVMADWIESLFLSEEVFVLSSDGIEQEVTIEESTVKRSTARDELPAYEFKYRLSKRNHDEFFVTIAQTSRIFDNTFDLTFN